jgi:hypothetical protein
MGRILNYGDSNNNTLKISNLTTVVSVGISLCEMI